MNVVALVFPHQLFEAPAAFDGLQEVWLVEDALYFRQYNFHRAKLQFHRASMQAYAAELRQQGYRVQIAGAAGSDMPLQSCLAALRAQGTARIHYTQPDDYLLERRLRRYAREQGIVLQDFPNPNFLFEPQELKAFFTGRKRYFQHDFYQFARKRLKLLLDEAGQPLGGRWSFDSENRKRLPAGMALPPLPAPAPDPEVTAAGAWTDAQFPGAPGGRSELIYPVTREQARLWLQGFLQQRLQNFGEYEDAISTRERYLFHSLLSPLLNAGLLSPREVLDAALQHAERQHTPLNSLEGFVRQLAGWREFIRAMYLLEGTAMRKGNFWQHTRPMPAACYSASTGILPVDTVIRRVLDNGYCHHIERLMVLGNFFMLCEIEPDEVYRWFMELFIDAYDWVMVPNVYGMSQFAAGGLMTTKPYFSGSNYLLKMSDFPKGPWCESWDALFWRFVWKHRDFFRSNPRLSMMAVQVDKMPPDRLQGHIRRAEAFLEGLK